MDDSHAPIRPDEVDGLFARFAAFESCALAVSGGSDSTALMVLFADWLRRRNEDVGRFTVMTVDHGLRAGSADEACFVAKAACELGYRHTTLIWQGPRPTTGIQAAARAARYRLMGEFMRAHGIGLLLTAHTRDDQAETLLMRLARGSGLDGLAAMAPVSRLGDFGREHGPGGSPAGRGALWIGRPFLDVPKACLRATLRARGIGWIEDPTNAAPEFERARLRTARAHLDAVGLTPAMLALSAARLARARRAVEALVDALCEPRAGAVHVDACGVIRIERARLLQAGEEVALRVLDRAIAAAGGAVERAPLSKLEALLPVVCGAGAAPSARLTLARTLLTVERSHVQIEREPGREPLPELSLSPGTAAFWDGRFWVTVAAGFAGRSVQVRALGEPNLRDLQRQGLVAQAGRAAAAVPAFWHEDSLMAAPSLGYWASAYASGDFGAAFAGIQNGSEKA